MLSSSARLSAAVALAVASATAQAAPGGDAASLGAQARKLAREGRPAAAAELYRAALLLDPDDPELHRGHADVLFTQGRCAEAVPEYRTFMFLAPLSARRGKAWDEAVERLAHCGRAEAASPAAGPGSPVVVQIQPAPPAEEPLPPIAESALVTAELELPLEPLIPAADPLPAAPFPAEAPPPAPTDGAPAAEEPPSPATAVVTAAPDGVAEPPARPGDPAFEWGFVAGLSPATAHVGAGLHLRVHHVALAVSSGFFPLAASASFLARPGGTGFYATAGWIRLGAGALGGGSAAGDTLFGIAGVEARPLRHLALRLGAGLAAGSVPDSGGPLRLELSAIVLP